MHRPNEFCSEDVPHSMDACDFWQRLGERSQMDSTEAGRVRISYHEQRPASPAIGDCWPVPEMIEGICREFFTKLVLSSEYMRDWMGKRPPLVVVLPGVGGGPLTWFCVDQRAGDEATGLSPSGWAVTGEPPRITVTPAVTLNHALTCSITEGVITVTRCD